ncbi:hypothetical protein GGX14DRAFT_609774 [Mycena pura]|uniref:Uncharacterized protein n=1 Tax=Mycena pura TaxID=153505 RepID=A0AAD6VN91_9AGAR|nr:hypothetical protein GGX14DRAFT_609774 [Mycena pura]
MLSTALSSSARRPIDIRVDKYWLFAYSESAVAIMNLNSTSVLVEFTPPPGGASNSHMALEHGYEVFVPDLGGDKIWRIGNVGGPGSGDFSIHGFIEHPKGTGPRHMVLRLSPMAITSPMRPRGGDDIKPSFPNGTYPIAATASTLAADRPANATFAAAEILLPPTSRAYPAPLLYVSNRNIGGTPDPRGHTIGIFEPAALRAVRQVYTGLVQIRGMALGVGGGGGGVPRRAGGGERRDGGLQAHGGRVGGCAECERGAEVDADDAFRFEGTVKIWCQIFRFSSVRAWCLSGRFEL